MNTKIFSVYKAVSCLLARTVNAARLLNEVESQMLNVED